MRLTKDEARILAAAMEIAKFEFKWLPQNGGFTSLEALEEKLKIYGKDFRRQGRTSMDDFNDCLKRYAKG